MKTKMTPEQRAAKAEAQNVKIRAHNDLMHQEFLARVEAQKTREAAMTPMEKMQRQLDKIEADVAKAQRYAVAASAPRDSDMYLRHFSESHPGYMYGN